MLGLMKEALMAPALEEPLVAVMEARMAGNLAQMWVAASAGV